jgi:hypothetical protein
MKKKTPMKHGLRHGTRTWLPRSIGSCKNPKPTYQEHGFEQVARAHAPCMGIWMPNVWAICNALSIHLVHPSGCSPMLGVLLSTNGAGHAP